MRKVQCVKYLIQQMPGRRAWGQGIDQIKKRRFPLQGASGRYRVAVQGILNQPAFFGAQ